MFRWLDVRFFCAWLCDVQYQKQKQGGKSHYLFCCVTRRQHKIYGLKLGTETITVWRTKEITLTLSLSLRISPFWKPAGTWGFLPPSSFGAGPTHPWLKLDVEVLKLNLNNKIETRNKIVSRNRFSYWNCFSVSFTWLSDSFNSHSRRAVPAPNKNLASMYVYVFLTADFASVNVDCN